ncbi:ABC transporter permease [Fusibacter sp. JL298sf-3]
MSFDKIINLSLIYAAFRSATPIIYASLCASVTQQANILNIGTEGIMLMGAFTAVAVSYLTGSWLLGVLVAMLAGVLMASIIAVGHLKYGAEITAIGIGINMFALAFTKYMLNSVLGKTGSFTDPKIVGIPRVHIAAFDNNEVLNTLFNNWTVTEWFAIVLVIGLTFVLFKTVWGLRLRAVGKFPLAAQTAGIPVQTMQYQALVISGLIGGLAGAHLSLGYSKMFTENMTNGRGFMGVAAMFFGGAHPVLTAIGCLVFGVADSMGARLQAYGVPSQFVLLMPYVVTVAVLAVSMATKKAAERKKKSALTAVKTVEG